MIRLRLLAALAAVIALGVLSRQYPIGSFLYDKSFGDALYASAAYLLLALVFIRQEPIKVGVGALVFCIAIETFKLTGVPAQYSRFLVVRWLLGSIFSWHNVWCYAAGIAFTIWLDVFVLRKRRLSIPA